MKYLLLLLLLTGCYNKDEIIAMYCTPTKVTEVDGFTLWKIDHRCPNVNSDYDVFFSISGTQQDVRHYNNKKHPIETRRVPNFTKESDL